jgi:hypothetical protein
MEYTILTEEVARISASSEDPLLGTLTPVGGGLAPRVLQALAGQLRLVLGNL